MNTYNTAVAFLLTILAIGLILNLREQIKWEAAEAKKNQNRCKTCHIPLKSKYEFSCDPECHAKYLESILFIDMSIDIKHTGYLFIKEKEEIK